MNDNKTQVVAEEKPKEANKEVKANRPEAGSKPAYQGRNNYSNNSSKRFFKTKKRTCQLCQRGILSVDYKDIELLKHYIDSERTGSILAQYNTGACTRHQRQISNAVHRARIVALLPFIKKD